MAITQVDLPAVYGAAQRYKQGQLQNELIKMQMATAKADAQKKNQLAALMSEYQGGYDPTTDITWNTGRQKAMTNAGRPLYTDAETGERYSEKSMTAQLPSGQWTNFPTVDRTGRIMPEGEAFRMAQEAGGRDPITGRPLNTFDTMDDAVSAAQTRSAGLRGGPQPMMGQGDFSRRAMAIDPDFAMRFQEHSAKMADAEREQMQYEAPLVARVMANVQDQEDYTRALNVLGNAGVDTSDMPTDFDPETVSLMIAMGTESQKLKPTSAMQEYQQAVGQGFKGTFLDYKKQLAQAGRAQNIVNVGPQGIDYGKPPKDYAWARDEQGQVLLSEPDENGYRAPIAVPVAGGPAEREIAAEEEAAAQQEAAQADIKAGKAQTMVDATSSIKEEIENADLPAVGTASIPFALYSGTAAGRVRSYVNTLKSGIVLGAMLRLKEASSTGATGFGQMNRNELQILIDDLGALDPDNTEKDIFLKTVNRIENQYKRVADDIRKNVSPERINELGLDEVLAKASDDASGGMNFSSMSPEDLLSVDVTKLTKEQGDAYMKALDDAGL